MSELHDPSALDLAAAVRTREVGVTEVVDHTLERAERIGPQAGPFVHLAHGGRAPWRPCDHASGQPISSRTM